ncbi:3-phosphoshikimate 1-carboxyvinyltransferase [Fibrella forsythiae]|uniref:3-phosphoshikimate 1-carboxyvinyltransferase n=1 Tax=Fibrella forsythiae TaxID=2817061 RepID=A0ABS3JEC4_9BACT|nr:3-phosphoshikimate 1-carboxyvinyltransferase [Fibrella forsythiae]MBO0948355.1 3-phosphoshikimate 1-carboxyvinyltransferase [Fibrella forsythiae]
MNALLLTPPTKPVRATVALASSKSESNRALILDALTGFRCQLDNLSTARDTQTMIRLLRDTNAETADVLDAGTTMRFLTAYFALTGQTKIMTGTPRMCERPIGLLVEALRTLGAEVTYLGQDGYPPLQTAGFQSTGVSELSIRGDVSSQYISALAMLAPYLPTGLTLHLTGTLGSVPYMTMTLQQMAVFGVTPIADWTAQTITIPAGTYQPTTYAIESDWSGASYWFSTVALADDADIELLGLKEQSLQGDSAIVDIMDQLGVQATYTGRGFRLTKKNAATQIEVDFTNCPDLAQTVAVCCAMKGIPATFTGIESLKIKETDRVVAIQNELRKFGADLVEVVPNERYEVHAATASVNSEPVQINTYDDHRMAMAFAPIAMLRPVVIEEPGVVAKSYPSFWEDFSQVSVIEPVS